MPSNLFAPVAQREFSGLNRESSVARPREAIARYLGRSDPGRVKGAIASLEDRVTSLEKKLAGLGRLVGGGAHD